MTLKMRPVLDHRMPTLAGKSAFLMPLSHVSGIHRKQSAIQQLEVAPARSLKHVRQLLSLEIRSVLKRISKLEDAYYGEQKTIHHEVENNAYPIKAAMKSVHIFECNSALRIEDILKKVSSNTYTGTVENVEVLRGVYSKVKSYLPEKVSDIAFTCHKLLDMLNKYCVSFYRKDPEKEGYLETSANYEEQIHSWRGNIESSLNNAIDVFRRFKGRGLAISHLTPPVENFVSKYNLQKILLLVIFADACTNFRNALTLMTSWIKTDETYSGFLRNDLGDLEVSKQENIRALRDVRSKYHSLTFKKSQLELDYARMLGTTESLEIRRSNLREEEEILARQLQEKELEIEFKEYRMEGYKQGTVDFNDELTLETVEMLAEDLKTLKEILPALQRQLATVRYKLSWVEEKHNEIERTADCIQATAREMSETDEDRKRKEKTYSDSEKSLKLARKIILCKTSNDVVEKLFYCIPVHSRNARLAGSAGKSHVPLDKACKVISRTIERDWVHLYRQLPFFPKRGSENIERDISGLSTTGSRETLVVVARRALERWRRHHTRAMVDDLKVALRAVRRPDVVRAIEEELKPPVREHEDGDPDDKIPPVPPELVEFYELGEKYDRLRALKKI